MTRFVDIPVGTKFIFEAKEYIKITDERISCCKVNNALIADSNEKTMIVPISEVTILEPNND